MRLGRRRAALVYGCAALAVPFVITVAVLAAIFPPVALAALLPSLLLGKPLAWALRSPDVDPPLPALAANVAWNLLTNAMLGIALGWLRPSAHAGVGACGKTTEEVFPLLSIPPTYSRTSNVPLTAVQPGVPGR